MALHIKILSWAAVFILRLRFPSGKSIPTILPTKYFILDVCSYRIISAALRGMETWLCQNKCTYFWTPTFCLQFQAMGKNEVYQSRTRVIEIQSEYEPFPKKRKFSDLHYSRMPFPTHVKTLESRDNVDHQPCFNIVQGHGMAIKEKDIF